MPRDIQLTPKITKYTIVRAKFETDFVTKVNSHISRGWTPLGGVSYAAAGMMLGEKSGNSFIQAMAMYGAPSKYDFEMANNAEMIAYIEDEYRQKITMETTELNHQAEKVGSNAKLAIYSKIKNIENELNREKRNKIKKIIDKNKPTELS